jgi:hypothetical protein
MRAYELGLGGPEYAHWRCKLIVKIGGVPNADVAAAGAVDRRPLAAVPWGKRSHGMRQ